MDDVAESARPAPQSAPRSAGPSPQATAPVPVQQSGMPRRTPSRRSSDERFDVAGKHVYLIGVGGCGMSGLARMLKARGAIVSGSDSTPQDTTEALEAEGIRVGFDQSSGVLPEACDMVIASAAIKPDHPQWLTAEARGIPTMLYAEALGKCMIGRTGIAIAGTHGKSTTTAMLGAALTDAGLDPSVIVGATCRQLVRGSLGTTNLMEAAGAGFRLGGLSIPGGLLRGKPGLLLAEACEFNRSFHNFRPTIAAITSVEADHLDVYGTLDAVVEAFAEFAALLPPANEGGTLIIAHDGAHRREVTAGLECKVETIGFSPAADWVIGYDGEARQVSLSRNRQLLATWTCLIPGTHNAFNSGVAMALALTAGADAELVAKSLSQFAGVDRRMQFLGEHVLPAFGVDAPRGVRVYDDYGHHPTEVEATLRALREFERPQTRNGRLICVFQPHQHSRTRFLLDEFAASFSAADIVIVPHIYFVRDSIAEKTRVSAADLVDRLRQRGVKAMHLYPFDAIVEQLQNLCRPGDVLAVMGAGPVWQVGKAFMESR
ncbi:MAG: Mur ligase domain-containing protein [Planctomycetota bacterium]|nr:Mur ligase domain-containing protein [Planctomycetota bacterium]